MSEPAAMSPTHTHRCLLKVEPWLLKVTIMIFIHHVVEHLLGVNNRLLRHVLIESERCDSPSQTFLYKVTPEVAVVLRSNRRGHIQWTLEIALRNHLEHHDKVLVDMILT